MKKVSGKLSNSPCLLCMDITRLVPTGVGVISPYYSPHLPEENLYHHFASLIDAVNEDEFPVFVYNNLHYSQNAITPKLLSRLAHHGLRGCKDSSFDIVNFFLFQNKVSKTYSTLKILPDLPPFVNKIPPNPSGFATFLWQKR